MLQFLYGILKVNFNKKKHNKTNVTVVVPILENPYSVSLLTVE